VSACSLINSGNSDLTSNLEKWQNNKTENYAITIDKRCYCPQGFYPANVVVAKDTVKHAFYPDNKEPIPIDSLTNSNTTVYSELYPTVDELFDIIIDASQRNADKLDVTYHDKIGYPEKIDIDYSRGVADDEITYIISEFTAEG
jgi:hypothetical protein